MKLKIRYENEFQIIELDEQATEKMWVSLSLEGEGLSQDEKAERIQQEYDEHFNKPEYNNWHKETRHIDPTPKRKKMNGRRGYICAEEEDKSFDIMDYLAVCNPYEEMDADEEYEETCEKVRKVLKPDAARMVIAIAIKGLTVAEYAEIIGDTANNVSHRYRRAIKKLKEKF